MIGCVLGNEFLDALPVHRVVRRDGVLQELYVDWSEGHFVGARGELTDGRLANRVGTPGLHEGQVAEVNLRQADWLSEVASELERGYVLLIDYGMPAVKLRAPGRESGTIRAFRGQHVSSDVMSGVGHQDITAHVDLDALAADAHAAGFEVLGRTTQADFLMGCGFDEIYQAAKAEADHDWSPALELRSAVRRLLDTQHMGAYAVVVLGKQVDPQPSLRGLSFKSTRPG
jgi:SAM-dependent MidA family methyltransferase